MTDAYLDAFEVFGIQFRMGISPVNQNSIQPSKRYMGDEIRLCPYFFINMKERIDAFRHEHMVRLKVVWWLCAEWDY